MGNALRSVSLRVRGYDEETEQLSEDLVGVTGKVADLTKAASNNGRGISLFTDESQTQYKDLVVYFGEIADVMDEISQKDKQELLELVSNSDVTLMENVDGSAYQELVDWSRESDVLLESTNGILFCIPKNAIAQ